MKQPTMDYDRSPEILPSLLRQMKQSSNADPVEWRLGRYTFRWERQGNVGRMVVTGIPGRVLPFVMLVETPEKARFYAPALVWKFDAGGLPMEGVFRRLDGAGVHSGALIAMAKGIPVMSGAGDENDGEDDDDIGVRTAYQGIPLKIDFPKGVYREGVDRNGSAWSKQMRCDYGEVDGLVTGADGDRLDVYVGDEAGAPNVYVIDQVDPETKSFDEQKFMLGFTSADAAKRMYLKHVPAGSCGRVAVFPIERFKAWLEASMGQPSAILKGMVTTATVAPAVPDSAEEGPVKVRHHVRVIRKDNGFHEIRFRPPSTRKRPTMRPSAIELDPSLADEGMTGLRGYTRKGDWAYRDTRLNKLLAKGLDEATATEQMRKRAMKRHAKTVDYPAGSFTATIKGERISGPVSFLTNDDGNVFPVSTSSPKAAKALNTPLHRKIMAKIIGSTTGANGGDHTKYVGHFAELHKDDAKGKTHEEFTQHLVDRIKEHSGNGDLGAALKSSLHDEAGKHVEPAPVEEKSGTAAPENASGDSQSTSAGVPRDVTFSVHSMPSNSKGWARFQIVDASGNPVMTSRTGNPWLGAGKPRIASIPHGTPLTVVTQVMLRVGSTSREEITTERHPYVVGSGPMRIRHYPGSQGIDMTIA